MTGLKPFWRYYGGKNRAASLYPGPEHRMVIEPFAGAAGYACLHYQREIVLVDRSPIIAGIWRYLIGVSPAEILRVPDIPDGGTVDDLPAWVPQEARWLVGFWCNSGTTSPRKSPGKWARTLGQESSNWVGWGEKSRNRIAAQVDAIRHWRVIEGDYTSAPNTEATWFIDPPYNNKAGSLYPHQPSDFDALGQWCESRQGFVMVCENDGADWLPFRPFASIKAMDGARRDGRSREVIWTNRRGRFRNNGQALLFGGAA